MPELNPYAKYLGGRPVETVLAATPEALAAQIERLGPARVAAQPAPGKWSPAEILAHLADSELVFAFRLRQTMAEPGYTIQPFDQDKWAATYAGIPAAEALRVFASLRVWNLRFIAAVLPGGASTPVTHPERGAMTFQILVETIAGHDLNHLAQFQRIAAA